MTALLLLAAFGAAPTLIEPVPLGRVLERPESFEGREILLEGKVLKACTKKGCWLTLADGDASVRITFKDYGFFVPKDCAGRKARAQGLVRRETLSVKAQRHYLKDAGADAAALRKITAPKAEVSFVASGVVFLD